MGVEGGVPGGEADTEKEGGGVRVMEMEGRGEDEGGVGVSVPPGTWVSVVMGVLELVG